MTDKSKLKELAQEMQNIRGFGPEHFGRLEQLTEGAISLIAENERLSAELATRSPVDLEGLTRHEELEAENEKLRAAVGDSALAATMLHEINMKNGGLNAVFSGGAAQLLAEAFGEQFIESGAANYLEVGFNTSKGIRLLVTLQRVDGKTPAQLRGEAEEKLAHVLATKQAGEAVPQEYLSLIANLAAVVRVQNGNRHPDTNALLEHAQRLLDATPPASPVPVNDVQGEREAGDIDALKEQSEAWYAVCDALRDVSEGWHANGKSAMEAAVATIKSIAAPSPVSVSERVVEGWKLVPVEPTTEMIDAANECEASWKSIYPAMLSAAPVPPAAPADQVRADALEEAAKLMESRGDGIWANTCGRALRSLIATPSTNGEQQRGDSERLNLSGPVIEIGTLEDANEPGFVIDRGTREARYVTVSGLTEDEVRNMGLIYGKSAQIVVRAASNGNSEKGGA